MAAFNNFCLVVAFMVSFALLVKATLSFEVPQPSQGPSIETNYAPRSLSSYEKYLSDCAAKLIPNCGDKIFYSVFFGNQPVSNYCCQNLVQDMGKSCHIDITKYIVKSSEFKPDQTQILQRSVNVWNDCASNHFYTPQPAGAEV